MKKNSDTIAYIQMTQGFVAVVDKDDYDAVKNYKWYPAKNKRTCYAIANIKQADGRLSTIYMHRLLLNCQKREIADHINYDGLDNRRSNIRKCTRKENNRHARRRTNTLSNYKGVCYKPNVRLLRPWIAQITHDYKTSHIGCFSSEKDAAIAYDIKAKELFGQFATLNFN